MLRPAAGDHWSDALGPDLPAVHVMVVTPGQCRPDLAAGGDGRGGISTGYHQLGSLVQARGRPDTFESLYRRALGISERIEYQASIATSYANLGGLS